VSSFAAKSRVVGDLMVVEPEGALDLNTVGKLRDAFTDAFDAGYKDLVVVLDGLDFMDSSGLGVIVGALKRARASDGSVRLVCNKTFILKTLRVTGLNRVFAVHDSLDAAIGGSSQSQVRSTLVGDGDSV
jgi:anti-sigma B factor antagonist